MTEKVFGGQSFLASIQNLLIFAIFKSSLNLNPIRHWSENWCPGYLEHAVCNSEIHLAAAKNLEIIGHVTNCCKMPMASDLRILRVFFQHPIEVVYHASKPYKLVVYCFYIIIQKTRDFSMSLLAQETIAD